MTPLLWLAALMMCAFLVFGFSIMLHDCGEWLRRNDKKLLPWWHDAQIHAKNEMTGRQRRKIRRRTGKKAFRRARKRGKPIINR